MMGDVSRNVSNINLLLRREAHHEMIPAGEEQK